MAMLRQIKALLELDSDGSNWLTAKGRIALIDTNTDGQRQARTRCVTLYVNVYQRPTNGAWNRALYSEFFLSDAYIDAATAASAASSDALLTAVPFTIDLSD